MIKAVKKDTGSFVYMKLKKHACPMCGRQLKVVKMKKTVRSKTKEAANFDFSAANVNLGEKVKFIWFEFRCPDCEVQYTEDALRKIEKKARADAAEAEKAERRLKKESKRADRKAEEEAACDEEETKTK